VSNHKAAVIPRQCTVDDKRKTNEDCPQQVFRKMPDNLKSNDDLLCFTANYCYTTNVEDASNSWGFWKKKKFKSKQTPNIFIRNID